MTPEPSGTGAAWWGCRRGLLHLGAGGASARAGQGVLWEGAAASPPRASHRATGRGWR